MTMTKERKKTKAGGISLSAPALKAALNAVAAAVPGKSVRPVLQNVLLSEGVLSGSDGEIRIDVELDAPPGVNFLLPKDRFSAILREFKGDEITITPDDTSCVIKAGRGEWTLPTEDAGEYPSWDVVGAKPITRMPADQFVRAVKGVVFAADNESSRFALGAVLIEVKGDVITFVATDGRRLALVQFQHDQAVDDSQTLVPMEAFKKCLNLIPKKNKSDRSGEREEDDERDEYDCDALAVQIEATTKEVVITVGPMAKGLVKPAKVLTALLVNGNFPRWREVLPERDARPTKVNRELLLAATRSAAICASEESKGVLFAFSNKGVWLQGKSSEKGEASVTCDVIDAGETVSVKMDPSYVKEWLNGVSDKKNADPNVEVEAVDADSAVILRCGDNTGVIMPLAVDG